MNSGVRNIRDISLDATLTFSAGLKFLSREKKNVAMCHPQISPQGPDLLIAMSNSASQAAMS